MLYADDADIVSRSPEGLERMMTVIAITCLAFGLTVWAAKTEIMCPQQKYGGGVLFAINTAGLVYKQAIEVVYSGGVISADRNLSIEITRCFERAWACFQRYKMEMYVSSRMCAHG